MSKGILAELAGLSVAGRIMLGGAVALAASGTGLGARGFFGRRICRRVPSGITTASDE